MNRGMGRVAVEPDFAGMMTAVLEGTRIFRAGPVSYPFTQPRVQREGSGIVRQEKESVKALEQPIPATMRKDIRENAADASLLLRVDQETHTPAAIVGSIDVFLCRWQEGDRPDLDEDDDLALMLGSLWGEQLVEALDWQWAALTIPNRKKSVVVGVFSPDRSLALYPFHAIRACLDNKTPVVVRLAFTILLEGSRLSALPQGGYKNIIDMVAHKPASPDTVKRSGRA